MNAFDRLQIVRGRNSSYFGMAKSRLANAALLGVAFALLLLVTLGGFPLIRRRFSARDKTLIDERRQQCGLGGASIRSLLWHITTRMV